MSPTKIGFVLLSNSRDPLPSTRIAVLNILPFLSEAQFEPHIVFDPVRSMEQPDLSGMAPGLVEAGLGIVFFQKVYGPSAQALARQLSARGVKTVFGVCDVVDIAMAEATDVTITVTDYLKSQYPAALQHKIQVVHDGIENPEAKKTVWSDHDGSPNHRLRAVLVTSAPLTQLPVLNAPPSWLETSIVGGYAPPGAYMQRIRAARWSMLGRRYAELLGYLAFLAHRRIHRIPWHPSGVYEQMQASDIGIIPIEPNNDPAGQAAVPRWMVKSENRLTMKMSIGLPVVATPIPAYEAILEHGVNGFLARSRQDWMACLKALRDPQLRREVGQRARQSVEHRFSKQEQARRLVKVLRGLVQGEGDGAGARPRE